MTEDTRNATPKVVSTASDAVMRGPMLVTVEVPRSDDGQILTRGDIVLQSRHVFQQVKDSIEKAGASLSDVALVQVYLVDMADCAGMNAVWGEFFPGPDTPQRATIGISQLALDGMLIEVIATAYVVR